MAKFIKVGDTYLNLDCIHKVVKIPDGSVRLHLDRQELAVEDAAESKAILDSVGQQLMAAKPEMVLKEKPSPVAK